MSDPTVLVVGAGPAGLTAARCLAAAGVGPVVVADREAEPGGVPRHCDHPGFGLQDLHRSLSGPAYARRLAARATAAGVDLRLSTTADPPADDGTVTLWGPSGPATVAPRVLVLATGARERPRAARLVPGDRPAGVFTTGQLQQWVAAGLPVGRRAVVVGAEHVAYSAVLTLRHARVTTVAMVTGLPRHQTVGGFALAARHGLRVPLRTSTRVVDLVGHGRLTTVVVEDLVTGRVDRVDADTVVFTGDWVPDHDLARRAGLVVERTTLAPRTDGWGRTSRPGVVAVGNLVHPGETAGRAALGARDAARRLAEVLRRGAPVPSARGLEVTVARPLASVVPSVVDPGDLPARLLVRTSAFTGRRLVVARQDGRELGRHRLRHAVPHRSLGVPGTVVRGADPSGGAVELALV